MIEAVRFYAEPELHKPELIAAWPGVGSIGVIAVEALKNLLQAEPLAEIEPWSFFYPQSLSIKNGQLLTLRFPESKFYYKRTEKKDLLLFIGGEQPGVAEKGCELAGLVLDVAQRFGCARVYTTAAAVASIHHTSRSRVWAAPNQAALLPEIKTYRNTILISEFEARGGGGNISGLNGLLLGLAKSRDLPGICLLGEIPVYMSQFPVPYPKAAKAILEVLSRNLDISLDLSTLDRQAKEVEDNVDRFYNLIPDEIRERIDQLKSGARLEKETAGGITDEDQKKIMQEVEDFFKKGGKQD